MHKIVKSRGPYTGSKNPRAKKRQLISPEGEIIEINGNINKICKDLEIIFSVVYKHIGNVVPPIPEVGFGGFRPLSEDHRIKRENTTGWKLIDIMEN